MQKPPLTDEEGEVRELTEDDFKGARPLAEVHPELIDAMKALRDKGGRPKATVAREHIDFRWAVDLVARIKATGKNYNARVEKIVREAEQAGKL